MARMSSQSSQQNLVNKVYHFGWTINRMYVSRLFKKWRWSYKTPERKQILKYTKENISYYGTYITTAYCIPWDRLKFMDEGHFVSKDLHRKRAIGPKGTRSHTVVQDGLNKSLSLTIMTTV